MRLKINKFFKVILFFAFFKISIAANIVDDAGEIIDISSPYTRIISLYGAHTEVLMEIGAENNLIGVDETHNELGKQTFSYRDNVEKFIGAKPDLVLIRPMIRQRFGGLIRSLESAGIIVATLKPTSFYDLNNYWGTLGILSGNETGSNLYIEKFYQDVKKIKKITSTIPKEEKKTIFFEARHKGGPKTTSAEGIPSYILNILNIENIAFDAVPTKKGSSVANFSKELLLSRGDKIDIYISQYGPMNKINIQKIKNTPGFNAIKAIREGKIYIIDENKVSRPTNGLLEGIYEIGNLVYPNYFDGGK